jgi:hypothetical protein
VHDSGSTQGCGSVLPDSHDEVTDAAEVCLHLVRWLTLAHALAVGDLFEKKLNEFSWLQSLVQFGLMTEKEHAYFRANETSRYVAPFVWFIDLIHELKDRKECGISDGIVVIMTGNLTRIQGSLADLYMYRNVPVPLSYRQLVNVAVRGCMVIAAIAGGLGGVHNDSYSEVTNIYVFWLIVPFICEYFLFVGWLKLADALANPFRLWADAFEWENYVRTVCISSNLFVTVTKEASTSTTELKQSTNELVQRNNAARAKWKSRMVTDKDNAKTNGLRKRLTGFD